MKGKGDKPEFVLVPEPALSLSKGASCSGPLNGGAAPQAQKREPETRVHMFGGLAILDTP